MGRRHQRNQNQSSIYSYAEREKDRKDGQYGTLRARLSADSFKEFDCCCLTLQPCREPLVSPDGYIYDKQAIIEYYLNQKKDMKRKLQAYYKEIEEEEVGDLSGFLRMFFSVRQRTRRAKASRYAN
jgi:nitric oxide synthase-interacting protein